MWENMGLIRVGENYMRTFSIIPDPTQEIYKEIIVFDGGLNFHPP